MKKTKLKVKQERFLPKFRGRSQQLAFNKFLGQFFEVHKIEKDEPDVTKSKNINVNIRKMMFDEKPNK